MSNPARELIATVSTIIYPRPPHDTDDGSGYTVVALADGSRAAGIDHDGVLRPGAIVRFLGRWRDHPRFGRQFQFSSVVRHLVPDRNGVIRYLTDVCEGIGKTRAAHLWSMYGPAAVQTLRENPDRVAAAGILTESHAILCSSRLTEVAALESTRIDLWSLLEGRGFGREAIQQCITRWGTRAPFLIRRNAFVLLTGKIRGAGFARCDQLYLDLGGRTTALKRQFLCGWHALREARDGDTWHAQEQFEEAIRERIGESARPTQAMLLGLRARWLASRVDAFDHIWVAERRKAVNEARLARCVARMIGADWRRWRHHQNSAGPGPFPNLAAAITDALELTTEGELS